MSEEQSCNKGTLLNSSDTKWSLNSNNKKALLQNSHVYHNAEHVII